MSKGGIIQHGIHNVNLQGEYIKYITRMSAPAYARASAFKCSPLLMRGLLLLSIMNEHSEGNYPLAYLITIRSYGTWLHGDERGSIDRHGFNTYGAPRMFQSKRLKDFMQDEVKEEPFLMGKAERICILKTVKEVCDFRGYELLAANIRTNHLHTVVSANTNPEKIVNEFKAYATRRLRESGLIERERKVWSRGKSRRYLWKPRHVELAVEYVLFGQGDAIPDFN